MSLFVGPLRSVRRQDYCYLSPPTRQERKRARETQPCSPSGARKYTGLVLRANKLDFHQLCSPRRLPTTLLPKGQRNHPPRLSYNPCRRSSRSDNPQRCRWHSSGSISRCYHHRRSPNYRRPCCRWTRCCCCCYPCYRYSCCRRHRRRRRRRRRCRCRRRRCCRRCCCRCLAGRVELGVDVRDPGLPHVLVLSLGGVVARHPALVLPCSLTAFATGFLWYSGGRSPPDKSKWVGGGEVAGKGLSVCGDDASRLPPELKICHSDSGTHKHITSNTNSILDHKVRI